MFGILVSLDFPPLFRILFSPPVKAIAGIVTLANRRAMPPVISLLSILCDEHKIEPDPCDFFGQQPAFFRENVAAV